MESQYKTILITNRPDVVAGLKGDTTVASLVDILLQKKVLTENEKDDILSKAVGADKVRALLDHIQRKPGIYKTFLEALRDPSVGAGALSDKLNPGLKLSVIADYGAENAEQQPENPPNRPVSVLEPMVSAIPDLDAYPMNEAKPGLCLIINNVRFKNDKTDRKGAKNDFNALNDLFRSLKFEVEHEYNLDADSIKKIFDEYSKPDRQRGYNCFICVIMSHGSEGVIQGVDEEQVDIEEDIIKKIQSCEALVKKPKIFLFQACRGDKHDAGVYTDSSTAQQDATPHEEMTRPLPIVRSEGELKLVPTDADVFIAYATAKGNCAYRTDGGSWFIQHLANVIKERHTKDHLLDILTEVNRRMSEETGQIGTQKVVAISNFTSTLTRRFYFKQ